MARHLRRAHQRLVEVASAYRLHYLRLSEEYAKAIPLSRRRRRLRRELHAAKIQWRTAREILEADIASSLPYATAPQVATRARQQVDAMIARQAAPIDPRRQR
ncbi:hypothetical protein [Sphaerisporangium album]|uniref:hypothetical protein n=1 Tax=Sphaerisporangium album TaxID=509200 RepID=UPI0011C034D4|nr:hypothetical protein [Sphaerisporangium album]